MRTDRHDVTIWIVVLVVLNKLIASNDKIQLKHTKTKRLRIMWLFDELHDWLHVNPNPTNILPFFSNLQKIPYHRNQSLHSSRALLNNNKALDNSRLSYMMVSYTWGVCTYKHQLVAHVCIFWYALQSNQFTFFIEDDKKKIHVPNTMDKILWNVYFTGKKGFAHKFKCIKINERPSFLYYFSHFCVSMFFLFTTKIIHLRI